MRTSTVFLEDAARSMWVISAAGGPVLAERGSQACMVCALVWVSWLKAAGVSQAGLPLRLLERGTKKVVFAQKGGPGKGGSTYC